jgi:hypothetical protein
MAKDKSWSSYGEVSGLINRVLSCPEMRYKMITREIAKDLARTH